MELDNSLIKIDNKYLQCINNEFNIENIFGEWIHNSNSLKYNFSNGMPFEHIVIDNFLNNDYAELLCNEFPQDYSNWYKYENPIEVKYAFDNINELTENLKNYFYYLSCDKFINVIKNITSIDNIEYDPYLHGAGLHCHPKHGRLNIHLDYEKHPYSGKERRINIIYFLNKNWNPEWNGANELWDKTITQYVKKTDVKFNRAIIFKTNDISWHGLPEKILCPENNFRKTLAYYYVSPLNTNKPEELYRKKAKYVKRSFEKDDENMNELYRIRAERRIETSDLMKLFPNWSKED